MEIHIFSMNPRQRKKAVPSSLFCLAIVYTSKGFRFAASMTMKNTEGNLDHFDFFMD